MTGLWSTDWATGDVVTAAEFRKSTGCVADSTLGVAAASFDYSGLPTTYAHLRIVAYLRLTGAVGGASVTLRFNNDSSAIYNIQQLLAANASVTGSGIVTATSAVVGNAPGASSPSGEFAALVIDVPQYAAGGGNRSFTAMNYWESANTAAGQSLLLTGGTWPNTAAINRVQLFPGSGSFDIGSRVSVYVLGS